MSTRRWLNRADRAALGLLGLWVLWAAIAGLLNDRPMEFGSPFAYAPVCLALGVLAGRWVLRLSAPTQVIGVIGIVTWVVTMVALRPGSGGGPLSYANANAALAIQLIAVCALIAVRISGVLRWIALLPAIPLALVPWCANSKAGVVALMPVLAAVALALTGRVRRRWGSVTVGALSMLSGAALIVWLASLATWPALATAGFSAVRQELWADALNLWERRPMVGSGPGSFELYAPLAADPDTATAHSSILQIAAETGLIGVAIFALLVAAGFAAATRGSGSECLIAAAAWTALGIHSFTDHLLEFPLVIATTGVVLGLVWGPRHTPASDGTAGDRGLVPRAARSRPYGSLRAYR